MDSGIDTADDDARLAALVTAVHAALESGNPHALRDVCDRITKVEAHLLGRIQSAAAVIAVARRYLNSTSCLRARLRARDHDQQEHAAAG